MKHKLEFTDYQMVDLQVATHRYLNYIQKNNRRKKEKYGDMPKSQMTREYRVRSIVQMINAIVEDNQLKYKATPDTDDINHWR